MSIKLSIKVGGDLWVGQLLNGAAFSTTMICRDSLADFLSTETEVFIGEFSPCPPACLPKKSPLDDKNGDK